MTNALNLHVVDETARLRTVIIGTATDRSPVKYANNPKSALFMEQGTYPTETDLVKELKALTQVLTKAGVTVLEPSNLNEQNQLFARDWGIVIGNRFIWANMDKENRRKEQAGIQNMIAGIDSLIAHKLPENAMLEGGDVVQFDGKVFVGLGNRSNALGLEALKEILGENVEVVGVRIQASQEAKENVLHLDCAFQPVGQGKAIVYPNGIVDYDIIKAHFSEDDRFEVTGEEMYQLFPNLLSISPTEIISAKGFDRVNAQLRNWGITVHEIAFNEVAKLGGLFRCVSLPLEREK